MANITLFAQVIQELPKELIKSLVKSIARTNMPIWCEFLQKYLGHYCRHTTQRNPNERLGFLRGVTDIKFFLF